MISNGCRVKLVSEARPKVVAQPSSSSLYSKYAENDLPIRSAARSRTSRFEAAHRYQHAESGEVPDSGD
jgi:hypothetical protein